MKKLVIYCALVICHISAFSQTGDSLFISGKVITGDGVKLSGAVTSLLVAQDSLLIKAVLTDEAGRFYFNIPAPRNYIVKVSYIGYDIFYTAFFTLSSSGIELKSIQLKKNNITLTGIVVTAQKSIIEQRIDATILNINDLVLKEAANAYEVLRFAPNVNLSENEDNIEMNGKSSVEVMLNGKMVTMTGRDLVKLLKSIPSKTVSQVEIISNPSAKYDIQGNQGIINIKMKKVLNVGINGNASISDTKSVNNMGDLSTSLNYGRGKLYISNYLAYHYGRYRTRYLESRISDPYVNPLQLERRNTNIDNWKDPVIRTCVDLNINSRSTIGGIVELERSTNKTNYTTFTDIGKPGMQPDSSIFAKSSAPNVRNWNTYNVNYRYTDTIGSEFNFDIDRSYYRKKNNNTINTGSNDNVGNPYNDGPAYIFNSQEIIDLQTFKADYTKSYKSKFKLEAGLKASFVDNTKDQLAEINSNNYLSTDSGSTNYFKYKEKINAAYVSIGQKYKKWGYQLGVRAEHTRSSGVSTSLKGINININKPDTSYLNILPSGYFTYMPDKKNSFRFSFIRRIKRPNYEDLEPVDYQIDQFYFHLGNPGLRVEKNSNIEINYSFNNKLNLIASYIYTSDYFTDVLFQKDGVLYEKKDNTGKMKSFNFNASYPIRPTEWWSAENRLTFFNNTFTGSLLEGYLNEGKWSYNLYSSQRFVVAKQYIIRLTGRYNAPQQRLYFFDASSGSVSLSFGKQVFQKKGTVRIGFSDIFQNQRTNTKVDFGSLKYLQKNTWESRSISLDFSLRFGSNKIKEPRERETGNVDEKDRTK
jgi:iron complex outermembrane receptor protein